MIVMTIASTPSLNASRRPLVILQLLTRSGYGTGNRMALDLSVAQALVVAGPGGATVLTKSDDFTPAWGGAAVTAAVRFGRRPAGGAWPGGVFAGPGGEGHGGAVPG